MKKTLLLLGITMLMAACTASGTLPPDSPVSNEPGTSSDQEGDQYAPQPGDREFLRGGVEISSVELMIMESYPPQFMLNLAGNLPTPCHQLRLVVSEPDSQNRIMIEAYSVLDPLEVCIQVIQNFGISYNLGSFPQGKYTLWINDRQYTEFEW